MYDVCIADDEILIQKSIATRLRASGIPVRVTGCAANAASAVSL
jgi:YesN/AraC family two-component response regulator